MMDSDRERRRSRAKVDAKVHVEKSSKKIVNNNSVKKQKEKTTQALSPVSKSTPDLRKVGLKFQDDSAVDASSKKPSNASGRVASLPRPAGQRDSNGSSSSEKADTREGRRKLRKSRSSQHLNDSDSSLTSRERRAKIRKARSTDVLNENVEPTETRDSDVGTFTLLTKPKTRLVLSTEDVRIDFQKDLEDKINLLKRPRSCEPNESSSDTLPDPPLRRTQSLGRAQIRQRSKKKSVTGSDIVALRVKSNDVPALQNSLQGGRLLRIRSLNDLSDTRETKTYTDTITKKSTQVIEERRNQTLSKEIQVLVLKSNEVDDDNVETASEGARTTDTESTTSHDTFDRNSRGRHSRRISRENNQTLPKPLRKTHLNIKLRRCKSADSLLHLEDEKESKDLLSQTNVLQKSCDNILVDLESVTKEVELETARRKSVIDDIVAELEKPTVPAIPDTRLVSDISDPRLEDHIRSNNNSSKLASLLQVTHDLLSPDSINDSRKFTHDLTQKKCKRVSVFGFDSKHITEAFEVDGKEVRHIPRGH